MPSPSLQDDIKQRLAARKSKSNPQKAKSQEAVTKHKIKATVHTINTPKPKATVKASNRPKAREGPA
jgi:hypothetical protein